ncbi:MAG: hypothetical protein V3T05_13315 [Myxococcota bacterium]
MRRLVAISIIGCVAACNGGEARPIRIELLNRTSCGSSTVAYDISCVKSLIVQLIGADGTLFRSQCTSIDNDYSNLQELIASDKVVDVLEGVRARSSARIELRGYHGFDKAPCTAIKDDDSELMLWGTSDLTDFTDPTLDEVSVWLDCRPDCDCLDFDPRSAECPRALVQGVCVPFKIFYCRKACETTDVCYGGLLSCELGCDPLNSPSCCAAPSEAGGMCGDCASDADCGGNRRCVHHAHAPDGPEEYFCAEACPPLPDFAPCPEGMSCQRLGDDPYTVP